MTCAGRYCPFMTLLWVALIVAGIVMIAFAMWPGKPRARDGETDRPDER